MIRFTLRCPKDHGFEGWFASNAEFEAQQAAGDIACPVCGATRIEKALMAPAVAKRSNRAAETPAATKQVAGGGVRSPQAEVMHALKQVRRFVEQNADYVGPQFAEEARRIHSGESDPRAIYGEATPEESEALAEDGIETATIPWIEKDDA
jgi:hypothetical protein